MIKYILLIILILITLINIYSFTYGRKIKKNNEQQLNFLKITLEKKSKEILKSKKITASSKHFFVSDIDEGFLLIFDKINNLFVVITETGYDIFYSKDVIECKNIINKEGKFLLTSKSIISTNLGDTEFVFGEKKRKSSTILAKFIIDTTQQFTSLIDSFIKEKN